MGCVSVVRAGMKPPRHQQLTAYACQILLLGLQTLQLKLIVRLLLPILLQLLPVLGSPRRCVNTAVVFLW